MVQKQSNCDNHGFIGHGMTFNSICDCGKLKPSEMFYNKQSDLLMNIGEFEVLFDFFKEKYTFYDIIL